ncbi:MAG: M23 family metallopeptidase [Steroidobacteraceae bacterium]
MNIVVFSKRWARARHYELGHPLTLGLIVMTALLLLGGAYMAGVQSRASAKLAQPVHQQVQIHAIRRQLNDQLADLAARVGQVNAQMLRLNALGKRLTEMAHLDKGEFNFDAPPAQGGPEEITDEPSAVAADLHGVLAKLEAQLIDRERQLVILETFISARQLTQWALPDGSPVPGAWISSLYGRRIDPITGATAFHSGIDFAAPSGAQAYAVAPGVVTWAGDRSGYGQLVEINHGNGYVTRYAHNSKVLVKVGDKVGKGKLISQVGSTGRSTGPHLHFEVLKNGRTIDPRKFVAG